MKKAECFTYVKRILREKELENRNNLRQHREIPEKLHEKYGECYARQDRCPNNDTTEHCDHKQKWVQTCCDVEIRQ